MKILPGKYWFIVVLLLMSPAIFGQANSAPVFKESEIVLKTSTGDIYGTLTVPAAGGVTPVVLIVPGSGPIDRNCNSTAGINTDAYQMLADGFAGNGISTVRYDKRGVGESKDAMTAESDIRFETYIHDVVDWISKLKSDKRFSKIFILGHSEGSLIGMIVAQQADVAGFISLAGVGRPADEVLKDQLSDKLPPEEGKNSRRSGFDPIYVVPSKRPAVPDLLDKI